MLRRQTKPPLVLAATAFVVTLGVAAGALSQNGTDKAPPPPTDKRQSSGGTSSAQSGNGTAETIFRPKETIAPGKPVSFPSDI